MGVAYRPSRLPSPAYFSAALLALVSLAANVLFALTFGETPTDRALLVLAACAAEIMLATGLLNIAKAARSRDVGRTAAFVVLFGLGAAYSLTASLGLASAFREQSVAKASVGVRAAEDHAKGARRIQTAIDALGTVRPAAEIQVQLDGILADRRLGGCKQITGPLTREHCPRVFSLRADMARTVEHARLLTDLANHKAQAPAAAPSVADPVGAYVSHYLAMAGYVVKPEDVRPYLTLALCLFIWFGSMLGVYAAIEPDVTSHKERTKPHSAPLMTHKEPDNKPDTTPPPSAPAPVTSVPSVGVTPAVSKLVHRIKASGVDVTKVSQVALAKKLNTSRTTLRRALAALEMEPAYA